MKMKTSCTYIFGVVVVSLFLLLVPAPSRSQLTDVDDRSDRSNRRGVVGPGCLTPTRARGACIDILKCSSLRRLILTRPLVQRDLEYLQRSTAICDKLPSPSNSNPDVDVIRACCPLSDLPSRTTSTTTPPLPKPPPPPSPKPVPAPGYDAGSIVEKILSHENLPLLPDSRECGRSLAVEEDPDRIIGGREAGLGTYPWMVLIGVSGPNGFIKYACGGTLINSKYILTAAHCLEYPGYDGVFTSKVRLGDYDKRTDVDCATSTSLNDQEMICAPKYQEIEVEEVILHEEYDTSRGGKENDIGLIRLKAHAALGPFVEPICLPHGEPLEKILDEGKLENIRESGERGKPIVAGWGRTSPHPDNDGDADVLQQVAVPYKSTLVCNSVYDDVVGENVGVGVGRFCAGGEVGKDSCQGDSGGPLMVPLLSTLANDQIRFFQRGLVSVGPGTCASLKPALYTRVSLYIPWILDHIKP